MRTAYTVHATTWLRQQEPEGWISIDDKPRAFKTLFAAELYVAGMTASDEACARRKGENNRTHYTITEDAQP